MAATISWGIIGTGGIARRFARGLLGSRTGRLSAVGSRSLEKAREFTASFPATAHGSYEGLLADPAVEAVYISTPHPMHAQWAIRAAQAGKHILCEKPLTINHAQAVEVVEAARANGVFLMEAFMYRCHPQTARILELVRQGELGTVRLVQASFSFNAAHDLQSRPLNPALGGGGILDVGCYCVSMTRLIAGAVSGKPFEDPLEVSGAGNIGADSRVDEFAVATLKFPGGLLAQLACGVRLRLENNLRITGTNGVLLVPNPWVPADTFSKLILFKEDVPEEIVVDCQQDLYALEADAVADFLGQRQAPAMGWEDSLGNMQTLDRWRAAVGMRYDFEP